MRARVAALAAALALVGAVAAPGVAAACPKTSLAEIEDEVMCPVCGTSLALASEAPQAQRQRAEIERLVATCASKDEIKERLVAELGDGVLALPDDSGFDLAAWVVPGLGIVLASGALGAAALGWRRTRRDEPGEAPLEGPSADRLQDDLDRYEL